jgi:hypothetical protein
MSFFSLPNNNNNNNNNLNENGNASFGLKSKMRSGVKRISPLVDLGRNNRGEMTVNLRREKRDDFLLKRRKQDSNASTSSASPSGSGSAKGTTISLSGNNQVLSDDNESEKTPVKKEKRVEMKELYTPSSSSKVDLVKCEDLVKRQKDVLSKLTTTRTQTQEAVLTLTTVGTMLNDVSNRTNQLMALMRIRKMLALEFSPPIKEIVECNFVPRVLFLIAECHYGVNQLRQKKPNNAEEATKLKEMIKTIQEMQNEGLWIVTNIGSGSVDSTRHLVEWNAIQCCIMSLDSSSEQVWSTAIWALGNIVSETLALRDLVITKYKLFDHIISKFSKIQNIETLQTVAWTFNNVLRNKLPEWTLVQKIWPCLAHLLTVTDADVLYDTCWAITHIAKDTKKDNTKIQWVVDSGVLPKIINLMTISLRLTDEPKSGGDQDYARLRIPCLSICANVISGDDIHTEAVIQAGFMPLMIKLLGDVKVAVRKDAMWALSNIASCSSREIQLMFDHELMAPAILMSRSPSVHYAVREHATWTICNAIQCATRPQIQQMVNFGIIAALCEQLKHPDPGILEIVLAAIEVLLSGSNAPKKNKALVTSTNIQTNDENENENDLKYFCERIEEAQGLDLLQNLQNHENKDVSDAATIILDKYFIENSYGPEPTSSEDSSTSFIFGLSSSSDTAKKPTHTHTGATGNTSVAPKSASDAAFVDFNKTKMVEKSTNLNHQNVLSSIFGNNIINNNNNKPQNTSNNNDATTSLAAGGLNSFSSSSSLPSNNNKSPYSYDSLFS